jgi:hypothetical protein
MKHHGGKGEPQFDGGLRAIEDAGIAVPAFLRIFDEWRNPFSHGSENLRWADVRTGSAGVALFLVKNGWHFFISSFDSPFFHCKHVHYVRT